MYKKIISVSLIAATAMFSGCGNDSTTCRVDVQKAIDEGRYSSALADLNGRCKTAFDYSDLSMNLAIANMGEAGYGVSDAADMLINSNSGSSNAFSSFLKSVDSKKKPNSFTSLTSANDYFTKSIATAEGVSVNSTSLCTDATIQAQNDSRVTNACLYLGFNDMITAASSILYLTGKVNELVSSIDNNSKTTPDDMHASIDALSWSLGKTYTKNGATIIAKDVNISGNGFAHLEVKYIGKGTFYRLAKSTNRGVNNSTVITDGYCDKDGNKTPCSGIEKANGSIDTTKSMGCYACPVSFDKNITDVSKVLVDTLNGGSDTISSVSSDASVTNSVNDFKNNITGNNNGTVTIDNIINYLQK